MSRLTTCSATTDIGVVNRALFGDATNHATSQHHAARLCRVGLCGATSASAQNDPALSAHLTLRGRVIGRIPTPDGTAPSRRPNARMRQHTPPPLHHPCARARLQICVARSAKTKMEVKIRDSRTSVPGN